MSFASPLGLLALLAVPAVLALHLFRRRLERRRVAGLFLFAPEALAVDAGRRRTRLLRTSSLWLELAAAVLLALWLAEPVFGTGASVPHLVFVLDDSASMAAAPAGGESCADRARAVVAGELAAAGDGSRVTIVLTGSRPEVVVGPGASVATALAALADWSPVRPAHDPTAAFDLALELGGTDARATFVTDGDDFAAPSGWSVVAVGRALPNAGFVHARRIDRGGAQGARLLADVGLWADTPRSARIELDCDGRATATHEVELSPGSPVRVDLAMSDAPGEWTARIVMTGDALALDDERVLLPELDRRVGLGVAVDGAVESRLALPRVLRAVAGLERAADVGRAPLRVTDARASTVPAAGSVELVVAPSGAETDAWIGPYWIERPHPLTEGLALDGVIWSAGREPLPGAPIVTTGATTLMSVERFANDALRVHLDLEPAATNLTTAPDWPVLWQNLAALARERLPGPIERHVAVGDLMRWRADPADPAVVEAVKMVDPDGRARDGGGVHVIGFEARRPGVHRLVARGEEVARFAAFFVDPQESDLRTRASFRKFEAARVSDDSPGKPDGGDEATWLGLGILLAVLADWWVLRRGGAA